MSSADTKFRQARDQYANAGVEFVPVRTRRGKYVHATTMHAPSNTACGRKSKRLTVVAEPVTCVDCIAHMHLKVKRKRRR